MVLAGHVIISITLFVVAAIAMIVAATLPTESQRNVAFGMAVVLSVAALCAHPGLGSVLAASAVLVALGIPTGIAMTRQAP